MEGTYYLERKKDPIPNAYLISISDVVVTVNSSVGFESLYFDKPVVVLGEAVYKPKNLFPSIDEFLSDGFDLDSYLQNIGVLRRIMLGGYLQPASIFNSPLLFINLVLHIKELWRNFSTNPKAILQKVWDYSAYSNQGLNTSNSFLGNFSTWFRNEASRGFP